MERAGSVRPSIWVIGRALGIVYRKKYLSRGSLPGRSKAQWFYCLWWRTRILSVRHRCLSQHQTCASFGIWRPDCLLHWLSSVSSNYDRTHYHTQESIQAKARLNYRVPVICTLSRGLYPFCYCLQNSSFMTHQRIQGPCRQSARAGKPFKLLSLRILKQEYGMFHSFYQYYPWPGTKRYQLYSWNYSASLRASVSSLLFYSEC